MITEAQTDAKIAAVPIQFKEIDGNSFCDVEGSPEALRFAIVLTSSPSAEWNTVFHTLYTKFAGTVHPPVEAIADRLWIDYLPRYEQELNEYIGQLRAIVEMVNDEMRQTAEIAAGFEHDERKTKFKDIVMNLKL